MTYSLCAGRHTVFVVNHPSEAPYIDRVEKFIFDPDNLKLKHQAYYTSEAMKTSVIIITSFYLCQYM
jgi:hypothetical protein